jgi:hypothetical protein
VTAVAEALEALGLTAGALPEPGLLADLFVRFQAQVPLRRSPEHLEPNGILSAWLETGAGSCDEPRVTAFEALATAAGFAVESALSRGPRGERRRVLLAHGRRLLLDPGFPLPVPLALDPPAESVSTGYGTLSVRREAGGVTDVLLETRGDERLLYRVDPSETMESRATRAPAADSGLFRLLEDRLLRWSDGVLEVSDAWSRLRVPLAASDVAGLEALFGPPIPAARPDPTVEVAVFEPTLAAYHSSTAEAPLLRRLLADPAGHAALRPEGWVVEGLSAREDGFEWSLREDGDLLRRERVMLRPDGIVVEAEGPFALFRTRAFRLEPRPTGTRLRLLATLRDPAPPRGLPEGTRRRLVFELASELLALDRLSAEA